MDTIHAITGLFVSFLVVWLLFLMTQNKRLKEKMKSYGKDDLTGLPLRGLLYERMWTNIHSFNSRGQKRTGDSEEKENNRLVAFFIDLDGFKGLNDSRGHKAGDKMLVDVSKALTGFIRRSDAVARLGGDEFVVFAEVSGYLGQRTLAEKILNGIKEIDPSSGVSASIGVSVYAPGKTPEDLVEEADQAMYQIKRGGKNGYGAFGSVPEES